MSNRCSVCNYKEGDDGAPKYESRRVVYSSRFRDYYCEDCLEWIKNTARGYKNKYE